MKKQTVINLLLSLLLLLSIVFQFSLMGELNKVKADQATVTNIIGRQVTINKNFQSTMEALAASVDNIADILSR